MKKLLVTLALALAPFVGVASASSPGFDDFVTLIQSGVDEEVVNSYIDASDVAYDFTAAEIVYLKDMGASSEIITRAINHGKEMRQVSSTPVGTQESSTSEAPADFTPPPPDADMSYFFEALAPYGNWMNIDGEWYWQPYAVEFNSDWRPYATGGHWVYTDAGWAWVSDYSWGWAPFHYGRWRHHPTHGWLWLPDGEWAPAWVVWRKNDVYCGWAPLPPGARFEAQVGFHFGGAVVSADFDYGLPYHDYVFIKASHFGEVQLWGFREPEYRTTVIFQQTTIVGNAYVYRNATVVNVGLPLVYVQKATKKVYTPVKIVSVDMRPNVRVVGKQLEVFRPKVTQKAKVTPLDLRLAKKAEVVSAIEEAQQKKRVYAAQKAAEKYQSVAAQAEKQQYDLEQAAQLEKDKARRDALLDKAEQQKAIALSAHERANKVKEYAAEPPAKKKDAEVNKSEEVKSGTAKKKDSGSDEPQKGMQKEKEQEKKKKR